MLTEIFESETFKMHKITIKLFTIKSGVVQESKRHYATVISALPASHAQIICYWYGRMSRLRFEIARWNEVELVSAVEKFEFKRKLLMIDGKLIKLFLLCILFNCFY